MHSELVFLVSIFALFFELVSEFQLFRFHCCALDCCLRTQITNPVQHTDSKTDSWNQFTLHFASWNKEFAGRRFQTLPGICNSTATQRPTLVRFALEMNTVHCKTKTGSETKLDQLPRKHMHSTVTTNIFTLLKQTQMSWVLSKRFLVFL